ncbi:GNAT family protein [Sphaerisporangium sp. NPDC051017]|uniref:GNAT family N-acetyltransferase n=1 Tax=Sphaerisporangium sp. NPDC051017 TaxID=3154636 RepID=UPI0034443875
MTTPFIEIGPVTLVGELVRLEPLTMEHLADLSVAGNHHEIWTYLDEPTPGEDEMAALIVDALDEQARGLRLPFAIIERADARAIGSISYIDIQRTHRAVEIGWAWVTPGHWCAGVAREAAVLLIRHAFETLGAIRVAFKTDSRNIRSQRALEGLGATREGTFRNHRILRDGHVRHSIYYSVIPEEWPDVAP